MPCSIYEAIGRGKHSVVYKGRKKKSIQYYAIKSVEKTQKPRVLQEVCFTLTTIPQVSALPHIQCIRNIVIAVQVRTMHALEHNNVLKFHAW